MVTWIKITEHLLCELIGEIRFNYCFLTFLFVYISKVNFFPSIASKLPVSPLAPKIRTVGNVNTVLSKKERTHPFLQKAADSGADGARGEFHLFPLTS